MSTIYTPTKSNDAHAAASTFRAALATAAQEGFTASALTDETLQDAVGGSAGHGAMLLAASELSLEHAMLVLNALDAAGVTAFKSEIADAIDAIVA
ncbi:MAG: hypothetical protein ABR616_18025 [Dermatophilaceae bacterium]|nr:hypothetical protein [Intrasporangiaceae bacterium]